MNTQIPSQIALVILIALVLIMIILILGRRIVTKPEREKLKAMWNSTPVRRPTPPQGEVQPPDPALNILGTDPRHCPFCRGDIEPGVLKCKHCGEWLDPNKRKEQDVVKKAQLETAKTSKSTNQAIGWVIFLLFGLPALYALFKGC